MGRGDVTVHGFRSTFRVLAGETTNQAREIMEAALAHQLPDRAEAAYARGDLFVKRRRLMDDWAGNLAAPAVRVRSPGRSRQSGALHAGLLHRAPQSFGGPERLRLLQRGDVVPDSDVVRIVERLVDSVPDHAHGAALGVELVVVRIHRPIGLAAWLALELAFRQRLPGQIRSSAVPS